MPTASPPRPPRTSVRTADRVAPGALADARPVTFEGRIRWDRVGRVALLALLAVVLLLYIAPLRHWLAQSHAAELQQSEVQGLERERNRLYARARNLERPWTIEREARRLGMVRRGERPFVIEAPGRS